MNVTPGLPVTLDVTGFLELNQGERQAVRDFVQSYDVDMDECYGYDVLGRLVIFHIYERTAWGSVQSDAAGRPVHSQKVFDLKDR